MRVTCSCKLGKKGYPRRKKVEDFMEKGERHLVYECPVCGNMVEIVVEKGDDV
jgi:hypothetical protein